MNHQKIVDRFFVAIEDCDSAWLTSNLDLNFSFNGHYPPFTRAAFIKGQQGIISGFSNWKYYPVNLSVKDNIVSGEVSISGKHTGLLNLPTDTISGFQPTFKEFRTDAQQFEIRFNGDKILTLWTEMGKGKGMQGVLQQLGIILDTFTHES